MLGGHRLYFSNINADAPVSTKVNTFTSKGGGGAAPQKPTIFKKNSNEMEAFPLR